ncbi:hypothetical protein IWQ62_006553, partial [Dispira parvispora]
MTTDEAYFHYTRGLKNALFQSVKIARITTLDEAQSYVLDLEEALEPRTFSPMVINRSGQSMPNQKPNVPIGNKESGPEPMDLGVIKRLTPEERQRCFREGRCLRCRAKGHLKAQCPRFPAQMSQMENIQVPPGVPDRDRDQETDGGDHTQVISSEVVMVPPKGYYLQLFLRSSVAKLGIVLSAGTIDPDYRGEIKFVLTNISRNPVKFTAGTYLVQAVLLSVGLPLLQSVHLKELDQTTRQNQGFGSSDLTPKFLSKHHGTSEHLPLKISNRFESLNPNESCETLETTTDEITKETQEPSDSCESNVTQDSFETFDSFDSMD